MGKRRYITVAKGVQCTRVNNKGHINLKFTNVSVGKIKLNKILQACGVRHY